MLEPSAGTGLLAVFAEIAGARLALNELGATRADLLARLFPASPLTRFDAAQIDDHLEASVRPSVVLMNPPFSVAAAVEGRIADAAWRHLSSALARLQRAPVQERRPPPRNRYDGGRTDVMNVPKADRRSNSSNRRHTAHAASGIRSSSLSRVIG